MTLRLVLLVVIVSSSVYAAPLKIPLTPVDSSFVIHGNKLGAGSSIDLTHTCVSCKVQITALLYDFEKTVIVAEDVNKNSYNTSNINGAILTPPLTVFVDFGSDKRFILAFTTVQLNETKLEKSYTPRLADELSEYHLREAPNGKAFNFSTFGNTVGRMAFTVVSDASYNPQLNLQGYSLYPNNLNCQADLYAGGVPSTYGSNKYYLTSLRSNQQMNFVKSIITVSAVTFVLPKGCDIKLFFALTQPPIFTIQLAPSAYGFAMSNEFPGNFVGEQTAWKTSVEYALIDAKTRAHFSIITADPGAGGSMVFRGDEKLNQTLVIDRNTTLQGWNPTVAKPKIYWNPAGPSRNGYLYVFVVDAHVESSTKKVETSTKKTPSTTTTTEKNSATLFFGLWVFICSILALLTY